jgi:hypothetical protein
MLVAMGCACDAELIRDAMHDEFLCSVSIHGLQTLYA